MTPWDYEMTTECEFIGGPVDGLKARINKIRSLCAFMEYTRKVVTVKSCGVEVVQVPFYNRVNKKRFQFIGYR
jgi:hypothetical protein